MTSPTRVAYVMSRFPKLSETFVLAEMAGVEAEGAVVEVFPLIHEREPLQQPEAAPFVARARFQPVISPAIARSAWRWLAESPRLLLATVAEAVRGVWGSWPFLFGLIGILPKTLHNARIMRDLGVDHIHAHFAHHPALSALIIHRLTGIPFSFTGHGHDIQVDRRMLCEKVRAASFAVAISEHNRELMTDRCPELGARVELLHTGVDPDALAPGEPSRAAHARWDDLDRSHLRVLSVGRLEPVKGHEVLLDGVAELRRRGQPVRCLVVGEGPRKQSLEQQRAAVGLGGDLRFEGSLTRAEVLDLMRAADVFVLPSVMTPDGRVEGIPVVLMEAMAVGTAVVASDLPGVRELLGAGGRGLRFPPGDHTALADALEALTDPDRRAELAGAARERIEQAFDSRTTARALAARFRSSAAAAPLPTHEER